MNKPPDQFRACTINLLNMKTFVCKNNQLSTKSLVEFKDDSNVLQFTSTWEILAPLKRLFQEGMHEVHKCILTKWMEILNLQAAPLLGNSWENGIIVRFYLQPYTSNYQSPIQLCPRNTHHNTILFPSGHTIFQGTHFSRLVWSILHTNLRVY